MEEFLGLVEDTIHKFFVPAILQEKVEKISDYFRQLLSQGVNQGGLNLQDPAKSSANLRQSSSKACTTCVVSLKEDKRLDSLAHA